MKNLTIILLLIYSESGSLAQLPKPPIPKKEATVFEEFGNKRIDNYYWMNDKKTPAVLEYINQENAYFSAMLKPLEVLQQELFEEMKTREAKSFSSLPVKRNGYWYYNKTGEGKSYPVYYRRKGNMQAKEEMIEDANLFAGYSKVLFFQAPVISPDNQLAAISYNTKGDRRYLVKIKNLVTKQFLSDSITNKSFAPVIWANDNEHFFYILNDKTVRPYKLMLHTVGQAAEKDKEVWQEMDSTFRLSISTSRDKKYLFLHSRSPLSSESFYIPLSEPDKDPLSISARLDNVSYRVIDHLNRFFYIYTNYDASNYRIVKTSIENSNKDNWKNIVAENKSVYIQSHVEIINNTIISEQKINGFTEINIHDLKDDRSYNIQFSQKARYVFFSVPDDAVSCDSIRLFFTSYAIPAVDYSYNLTTKKKTFIRQEQVKNFIPGNYKTVVFQVKSRDGELVPVNMVYNKNKFRADGNHPLLLETYSWYGADFDPFFNNSLLSLLDQGFAYAYVYARGGLAKGAAWWKAGRRLNRTNTFYDIVDIAQWLVENKYTSKEKLTATGGSAGGTNIGAIVNLRPDLFKAVIADVPWLDVITDMKDPSIPGVTAEYEEEGNPNIESEYRYMLTWSPYDNIKKADYPAILATSGWFDTNVPFYHAAKWIGKIRDYNTGISPVLLICNTEAGHAGSTDRFERLKMTALQYAFLIMQIK